MTVPTSKVKVVGLEQALKDLRKTEPEFVSAFRKQARANASEAVQAIKVEFDHTTRGWSNSNYPLTGMRRGSLIAGRDVRWGKQKARRGIKFKLGGPRKSTRKGKAFRMFSLIQADPAGSIYDMAGKKGGAYNPEKQFEENLLAKDAPHQRAQPGRPNKGPSRYMWPGAWFYLPQLEDRMTKMVHDLERKINKQLVKRPRR